MRQIIEQWSRWSGMLALLAALTGCGGQSTVQTVSTTTAAQETASSTAVTVRPTVTGEATATPTALPIPTATSVSPTATSAPVPTPTIRTSASSTTAGYTADFSHWPVATPGGSDPARVSYDAASGHYTIALTASDHAYVHWQYAPEGRAFGDFTLDVDGQVVGGPPGGSWGVLFRAQPQRAGDKTNARYDLIITPDKKQVSLNWTGADGGAKVLALAIVPAVHTGDALNHIHLVAQGARITVAVNDQTVGSATGPSTTPGAVGLITLEPPQATGSPGTTSAFSHLVVTLSG